MGVKRGNPFRNFLFFIRITLIAINNVGTQKQPRVLFEENFENKFVSNTTLHIVFMLLYNITVKFYSC